MDKTIIVTVRNKIAVANMTEYVCGNDDFVVAFDFDQDWDEYDVKTARFKHNGTHTDVVFSGNSCNVPRISDTNSIKVGVFAGDLSTTTSATILARKSILCGGSVPAAPTEDVYNQIMKEVNDIAKKADEIPKMVAEATPVISLGRVSDGECVGTSIIVNVGEEFVGEAIIYDGKNGKDGEDGEDGFSPLVSATDIEGGHRVTITDKNGNTTFDVMDGEHLAGNPVVAPGSIQPYQTDFIENYNLYDRTKNTEKTVISSTGAVTSNSSFQTSDYIHMPAGSYWVTNTSTVRFEYYAVYDLNKKFVSRVAMAAAGTNVITIATDCFVRFMGYNTKVDGKDIMVVYGEEAPSGYIPHGVRFTDPFALSGENIDDKTVRKEKTDFIQTSTNLINHMTVEKGYVVNTSGAVVSNSQYGVTEKIYVKPSTKYVCNNVLRLALYKSDGTLITVQGKSDPSTSFTFTTTTATAYVIAAVQVKSSALSAWQMNEGETLLEYEKQHLIINGYRLHDEIVEKVDPIDVFKKWDKIIYDKSQTFTLTTEAEAVAAGERTASAVIEKYDALAAANPLYITKTEVGADSVGNMLYRYDFNEPEQPYNAVCMRSTAKPKVILIGGVHPEWGGIYSLYNTMKQITENEALVDLRRNTHFIVIPIVNVYGCTNASRKNANGIDLARNFEVEFTVGSNPSENTYGGTVALSELEAQYVDAILRQNQDAVVFLSCHSFQTNNTENDCIWGACGTRYMNNLCKKVIDKLSRVWRNKYDFVPDDVNVYLGSSEVSAPGGSEGQQAAKYNIQGATLEVGDYFRYQSAEALTSFVISRGTETYINFIMTALCNFNSTDKKLM